MCTTCGCDEIGHEHEHEHEHEHRVITKEIDVLEKSRRLAASNRAWLRARGVSMLNVMSSPGAGKTTLLERTVRDLSRAVPIFIIEGDQATQLDADRVRAAGARAVQVNTGAGCHLDPHMVRHALEDLDPPRGSFVFVENVGNLVCPALFDLGESERVVLISTPEGDEKPLKYPHMFQTASLVVLNKIDLLSVVPFDMDRFTRHAASASPRAELLCVSAWKGDGLDRWYAWILDRGTGAHASASIDLEGSS